LRAIVDFDTDGETSGEMCQAQYIVNCYSPSLNFLLSILIDPIEIFNYNFIMLNYFFPQSFELV